jgi:hypothetical protein
MYNEMEDCGVFLAYFMVQYSLEQVTETQKTKPHEDSNTVRPTCCLNAYIYMYM